MLFKCSLKFNYESIVIPSSVTDEANFMVIKRIFNVCEPVFPRIINWNLSGFGFNELNRNHSYTFYIPCIRLVNMLSKFVPQK